MANTPNWEERTAYDKSLWEVSHSSHVEERELWTKISPAYEEAIQQPTSREAINLFISKLTSDMGEIQLSDKEEITSVKDNEDVRLSKASVTKIQEGISTIKAHFEKKVDERTQVIAKEALPGPRSSDHQFSISSTTSAADVTAVANPVFSKKQKIDL